MPTANKGTNKGVENLRPFKPGQSGNPNGRPKKPEWLKGKGEEALRFAYEVMLDEDNKTELRMQAARMLVEYDLGKPAQALDIQADVAADTTVSMIGAMSLSKRGAAMKKALEAYEKNKAKTK